MSQQKSPGDTGANASWPSLPFHEWKDTYATLHMWTQVVGKIRLAQMPWINHSWHTTLYVTSRGLTTSPIPHGTRTFEIDFDFVDHTLLVRTSDGELRTMRLAPRTVSDFYGELLAKLAELKLDVKIHASPNEVAEPIPFSKDLEHSAYDPEYANRFWRALVQIDRVFTQFRARFIGKCSPVHFFWGSFDLAVTRFSGRRAPAHPGGIPNLPDWVTREAYSHEVSSCGFWPGSEQMPEPVFYSYAYPLPEGFDQAPVGPDGAYFSTDMKEFLFPYERVRQSTSPDDALLEFLQTTYEAAANAGGWQRLELEKTTPP